VGSAAHLLALVASIEEHATHPVADAVVKQARQQHLATYRARRRGLSGGARPITTQTPKGDRVAIGSRHFLETHRNVSFAAHEERIAALEQAGKTLALRGAGAAARWG
jgi:cation-transporting P-type ATPase C